MTTSLQEDRNGCKGNDKNVVEVARDIAFSPNLQYSARPRSLSDISTADADVGVVVLKAKRAAKSLWMIIHAQNCRIAGTCCPHRGCQDTKKLLLHVKTCPAGPGFDCPEGFNGCLQAKKLLMHYRRCRDVRARQARQPPTKRLLRQQQHSCLVCSLMARHAKTVLDSSGKSASSSNCFSALDTEVKRTHNPAPRQHLKKDVDTILAPSVIRSTSMQSMPPPPPRLPQQAHSFNHQSLSVSSKKTPSSSLSQALASSGAGLISPAQQQVSVSTPALSQTNEESLICCTPPSQSVLEQQIIADVAAAAAPSPVGGSVDPALLGKSFDSSKTSYLSRQSQTEMTNVPELLRCKLVGDEMAGTTQCGFPLRTRAESYDERSASSMSSGPNQRFENDPTVEATLTSNDGNQREFLQDLEYSQSQLAKQLRFGKRRSASCGVLSTLSGSACDTIEEDSTYDDNTSDGDEPIFICDDEKR